MAKPKRYRWACPRCEGGLLASSAPRKDSVARYCLPCSKATGKLVERVCPALEKARVAKERQRLAAAKRKWLAASRRRSAGERRTAEIAAKRRSAQEEVAGDLHVELERIWPIAHRVTPRDDVRKDLPALSITMRRGNETTGRAWGRGHRIHISIAKLDDAAGTIGVLAHEVAHLIQPRGGVHSQEFWLVLVALVREAYDSSLTIEDINREPRAYEKQCAVEHAIRTARGYS